ncbi:Mrp/NBP35 family ATP-binding protein [Alistipes sp. OttesenSCG-928-L06]|nr:Mrp/NBP35 family ATP-binding protein [Alistipes sp. OttesenSCG-928-L06]
MQNEQIRAALSAVVHPDTQQDIVTMGLVEDLTVGDDKIQFTLNFPKARDPFLNSIRKAAVNSIETAFPAYAGKVSVTVKEAAPKKTEKPERATSTGAIENIIAVSSAKGGVGKSTVTANLAVALARAGYRVGVMDADIYGPSMPKMFGVEDYVPLAETVDGRELIRPAESHGVKVMSIGFFINPDDALVWRGAMATNALRQLIHQSAWGGLDFLLIDMPPGTGDIQLTIVQELAVTGAVIVSTPQAVALADVVRGIKMYRSEGIDVPVLGLVENMAWFTPAELPDNKYYIFGQEGVKQLAEKEGLPLLGQIPLVQSVRESGDAGTPVSAGESITGLAFSGLAGQVVDAIRQRNRQQPPTQKVEVK